MTPVPISSGRARFRRLAVACALAVTAATVGPAAGASAAPAQPYDAYGTEGWKLGDPGFVQIPYGSFPSTFMYTFMMNNVGYQGPPSAPSRTPKVGEIFYMRLDTTMVTDLFADDMWYQMDLILPDGLVPALTAEIPMYCYISKYDDTASAYLPEREFPGCAADEFGAGYRFTTVNIKDNESAMVWLPVLALKPLSSALVQLTSYRTAGDVNPTINPLLAELDITVGANTPTAPRAVSVVKGKKSAKVSWSAPVLNGGRAITAYTVRAWTKKTGGTKVGQCTTTGKKSCTITGLRSRRQVFIDVIAKNALGTSPASSPRRATTPS